MINEGERPCVLRRGFLSDGTPASIWRGTEYILLLPDGDLAEIRRVLADDRYLERALVSNASILAA